MEVVDLCDSEDELPSLTERLQKRQAPGAGKPSRKCGAPARAGAAPAADAVAAAGRQPLAAADNHVGSPLAGGSGDLLAGAEALRRRLQARAVRKAARDAEALLGTSQEWEAAGVTVDCAAPQRPQYHHQEQHMQLQEDQLERQHGLPGIAGAAIASQPASQQQGEPWHFASQPDDGDEEWQPLDASQPATQPAGKRTPSRGRRTADSSRQRHGGEEGEPPSKKARKPKRTKEQIEHDKAVEKQLKEDKKARKQASSLKWALQQVKLQVDSALMCSGSAGSSSGSRGGKGSLGVQLLAKLDEHNSRVSEASKEKRIQYEVAPLDMAPFKALRWRYRHLVEAGPEGLAGPSQQQLPASQASAVPGSQLEELWEEAPHVMLCFQPQEFIDAVLQDRLASLFDLLERKAPGQRAYLMVCGLFNYIRAQEQRQHRADMAARVAPAQVQQSVQLRMEEFVTELAVRCPGLSFRDVVDDAQAAEHVQRITVSVAYDRFAEDTGGTWLRGHDKSDSQANTNFLINNPLPDKGREPFFKALASLPSVGQGIAHPLVATYGSLAELMDFLLDSSRSDADKQKEIAEAQRVGGAGNRRVGPAAARQLLQLLRSADPDLRVKEQDKGK